MMEFKFLFGSVVSIGLFMVVHLVTAVWWASQVTAAIDSMKDAIKELRADLKNHDDKFFGKQEAKDQVAKRDREMAELWLAVNLVRKEFHQCQVDHSTNGKH
jgi:hypothetical protein